MDCARAFGACITLRDSPEEPIPEEFKPSEWHKEALTDSLQEMNELEAMTDEQAAAKSKEEWERDRAYYFKAIDERNDLEGKYRTMLKAAKAFQPPTEGHAEYKAFMVSQIQGSLEHDCGGDYLQRSLLALGDGPKSAKAWREEKMFLLKESIERHTKEYAAEVERCNGRTQWISELRKAVDAL